MASQLTLQTKVKLPSGHQIPQLGYGVSAVLLLCRGTTLLT